ncbi:NAD(P)-dependent oxidoreductase [Halobacteriaceae archaeon GCM10025711]
MRRIAHVALAPARALRALAAATATKNHAEDTTARVETTPRYKTLADQRQTMETVGFIGLGAMGAPMAWNVRGAGYDLRVWNRTTERAEPFQDEGATVCSSPREVAEGADVVVTMVTDDDALFDVLEGEDGVFAGLEENTVLMNMSTVSHDATARAADEANRRGAEFVDAPVSGTVGPAQEGVLTVLVGGDDAIVEMVTPVLEAMGSDVVRCGPVGQGTNMKLFINLLLGGVMETFAEALVFGKAHDLDVDTMLDVVGSGPVAAPLLTAKGEAIRDGDFAPQFPVDLLFKDLDLVLDAAGDAEVPLPATAATREAVNGARALGHGDEDMAAVVRFLEETAGVQVRDGAR